MSSMAALGPTVRSQSALYQGLLAYDGGAPRGLGG